MATLGSGLGRLQPAAARQRQDTAADGHSLGGDTFPAMLAEGRREEGMELGAQRVGGDEQREWMGQGLAAAAMGAPAMPLAVERRRKNGESRRREGKGEGKSGEGRGARSALMHASWRTGAAQRRPHGASNATRGLQLKHGVGIVHQIQNFNSTSKIRLKA